MVHGSVDERELAEKGMIEDGPLCHEADRGVRGRTFGCAPCGPGRADEAAARSADVYGPRNRKRRNALQRGSVPPMESGTVRELPHVRGEDCIWHGT